jgi:hypothetical protein
MRLVAFEIPDEPTELPAWLESQLLGFELAALVAELEAIHGDLGPNALPLDRLLGSDRGAMLERGLSALPLDRLREFLHHPRRLLDLQELVLVEGGAYWQNLSTGGQESARLGAAMWRRLHDLMTAGGATTPTVPTPCASTRRNLWRLVAVPATAASLLAAILVYQRSHEPAETIASAGKWGWLRPDAFPQELPAPQYLNRLADEAAEWLKKRPDEPVSLARRIAEFRQGCTALLLAEHRSLSPHDRQWLAEICRQWASDLDKYLAEVENRVNPLLVRAKVDETARKIAKELRDHAAARA